MPEGWKWIAPNLRGHGSAPTSAATMDDCAADLVALWDQLGIERSHVVGYSMGGRLALPMFAGIKRRGDDFAAWLHWQRMGNRADGLAASLRGMGAGAMEPLWAELE